MNIFSSVERNYVGKTESYLLVNRNSRIFGIRAYKNQKIKKTKKNNKNTRDCPKEHEYIPE